MKTMAGTISIGASGKAGTTNVAVRLVAFARNIGWRLERQRGRHQLAELTADELRDIGITPEQARKAAAKHIFED